MAKFRYMVSDAAAAAFYTENFGFSIELQVPAILYCLSGRPDTLAQRPQKLSPMPVGRQPEPGGWNRLLFEWSPCWQAAISPRSACCSKSFPGQCVVTLAMFGHKLR